MNCVGSKRTAFTQQVLIFLLVLFNPAALIAEADESPKPREKPEQRCTISEGIAVLIPEGTELQNHLSNSGLILMNDHWVESSNKWEEMKSELERLPSSLPLLFIIYSERVIPEPEVEQLKQHAIVLCAARETRCLNLVARENNERWSRLLDQFTTYESDVSCKEDGIGNEHAKAYPVRSPFSIESTREANCAGIILKTLEAQDKFPRQVRTSLSVCLRNLQVDRKQNVFVKLSYKRGASQVAQSFRKVDMNILGDSLGYEMWTIWLSGDRSGYITWKQ